MQLAINGCQSVPKCVKGFQSEILTEMYIGHPYLITALFEIRPVAYFGPKQDTFDQQTLLFLLQYGVTGR